MVKKQLERNGMESVLYERSRLLVAVLNTYFSKVSLLNSKYCSSKQLQYFEKKMTNKF